MISESTSGSGSYITSNLDAALDDTEGDSSLIALVARRSASIIRSNLCTS